MWSSLKKPYSLIAVLGLLCPFLASAQDSLRIGLPEAEARFLKSNLTVLAAKYDIPIASALVMQAKLYPNPNLQVTGGLYNPDLKKFPDVSNQTGQYTFDVQQLIILAGKRAKQVKMATLNLDMAQNRFYDLLRNLKYALHSDFYQIYTGLEAIKAYDAQIATLQSLVEQYKALEQKGVVTGKDRIRIQSLLYGLQSSRQQVQQDITDAQSDLQLLLHGNGTFFVPVPELDKWKAISVSSLPLQSLVDSAYNNRFDLKLAQTNVRYSEQNLALQKAMAVPDLTLGAQFDKRGSYVNNANFLTLAIDLPFFNRNQGNIKAAKLGVEQDKMRADIQKESVENDVMKAYSQALNAEKTLQQIDGSYLANYQEITSKMLENFQKKNISLLELTDFLDSYKESILQMNQLTTNRFLAVESLSYAVGTPLFNL
jgi:outer membrane protein, heavy metal efflux system